MRLLQIQINRLPGNEDIPFPSKMTKGASGFDLYAAVTESVTLAPGERRLIPTGLSMAIPEGWEGQVRPRSGLALKHGITALNSPGTIDSDYRGEIGVILINHGQQPFVVDRRERIAQFVIQAVPQVEYVEVSHLEETQRGSGGFGHTGKK
jgi:dUTP pyrophosphatase